MKILLSLTFIMLLLNAKAQSYEQLSPQAKHYVDSVKYIKKSLPYFRPHGRMISFTEFGIEGYEDFWKYLIQDEKCYTSSGSVDIVETNGNYKVKFYKMDAYQNKKPVTIDVIPVKGSDMKIKEARITASFNVLADLYIDYFGGHPKGDLPPKGGLDKTYTPTDEVRIFSNYILITPHKKTFSTD